MRNALLLAAFATAGCATANFRSTTAAPLPPAADRALLVDSRDAAQLARAGRLVGAIDARGIATDNVDDLVDRAGLLAANHGGTHLAVTSSGVITSTTTTPASQSTTCTDATDSSTCTTTYTPESTTTSSTPYAAFDVYRVEREGWAQLPPALHPAEYDPAHHAATVADGFGLTLGYFMAPFFGATGSGTSGEVFPTAYSANPSTMQGGWLGMSWERGGNVLAFDVGAGGGTQTGTAMNTQSGSAAAPYTLTYGMAALKLRAGKKLAWRAVALAAGVGVEGAVETGMTHVDGGGFSDQFVEPPTTALDFALPIWAEITVKTGCDWGVQGLAEYDVRPFAMPASAPAFGVGLLWQPASACR